MLCKVCDCLNWREQTIYRIVHVKTGKHCDFSTSPSPILTFFFTFAGIKKQKISACHVFRKYRLKTIKNYYSGTHFLSLLDFRLILSITAQSILTVEPNAWARWKGFLIENITKKKQETTTTTFFFIFQTW
jgi:hypothetical protein